MQNDNRIRYDCSPIVSKLALNVSCKNLDFFHQVGIHDSTRSVQKKKEQLNASKRLLEEQEDEIMVNMLVYLVEFLYHVYRESGFFFDPTVAICSVFRTV
jgi:hypothetical protein